MFENLLSQRRSTVAPVAQSGTASHDRPVSKLSRRRAGRRGTIWGRGVIHSFTKNNLLRNDHRSAKKPWLLTLKTAQTSGGVRNSSFTDSNSDILWVHLSILF